MAFASKNDSLTLHTDLYQINMMYTYFKMGLHEKNAVFECYFRNMPFDSGYAVFAGLEHIVSYLEQLKFDESDLEFLRQNENYDEDFIDYLRHFQFKCSVNSVVEGEIVFNNEPLLQVEGPLAQCQLIETAILNFVNFQTLVATKASRIKSQPKVILYWNLEHAVHKKQMLQFGEHVLLILLDSMRQVMFVQESYLTFQSAELTRMH